MLRISGGFRACILLGFSQGCSASFFQKELFLMLAESLSDCPLLLMASIASMQIRRLFFLG